MNAVRWGDNDKYFGPFTWHPGDYMRYGIVLESKGEESRSYLRLHFRRWTLCIATPEWLLRPETEKVYPGWDAATIARLGRDWYLKITRRSFGWCISQSGDVGNSDYLQIFYGRNTHDSSTEQRWGYFLPWTQWRHVRHSYYDLAGNHFADAPEWGYRFDGDSFANFQRVEESVPIQCFDFADFDGEKLTATTRIEEREWRFGTGWFKWLSLFRRSKVSRSLDIRFSGETGKRKGSWKGGTIGHSIEMLPGELHRAAFERYCTEHEMTLKG